MGWLFAAMLAVLLTLIAVCLLCPPRQGSTLSDYWIGVGLVIAVGTMLLIAAGTARAIPAADPPAVIDDWRPAPTKIVKAKLNLVSEARKHIGKRAQQLGLPPKLWCSDFLNFIVRRVGWSGTGSRLARSWAWWRGGERVKHPRPGDIAVFSRHGGGHVGIVVGVNRRGIVVISGNHGRRVAQATYPRRRVVAYVRPRSA